MQQQQPPQLPQLPYTELEFARLEGALARRSMFQAQTLAIDLATNANEQQIKAIVTGAEQRLAAEAAAVKEAEDAAKAAEAAAGQGGTGQADVIELRGSAA